MGVCVATYLRKKYPEKKQGFLTDARKVLVNNECIGQLSRQIGLDKFYVISRHNEESPAIAGRNNTKKLGDIFEAFIGAIFLDMNKISVKDEDKWFSELFVCGPGFQMSQIFVENVFKVHIDWTALIQNDDNYKNILQVKIQKEFKVTPHYAIINQDEETGYKMGVYLCLGQDIWNVTHANSLPITKFNNFKAIQDYLAENGKVFLFL